VDAVAKRGAKVSNLDPGKIWADTMAYQFGAIPNAFNAVRQAVAGGEDVYATVTGEPTKGFKAPSIGKGLQSISKAADEFGASLGENLPSAGQVFGSDQTTTINSITDQNAALQQELDDARSQLQDVFSQYPFTETATQ